MAPSGRLQGRAAIITGGEGSIGMATARALVAEGASVCLIGLVAGELRAGAESLGGAARWAVADVTDADQVKTAVAVGLLGRSGTLDLQASEGAGSRLPRLRWN